MFLTPLAELLNTCVQMRSKGAFWKGKNLAGWHFSGMSDSTYVGRHKNKLENIERMGSLNFSLVECINNRTVSKKMANLHKSYKNAKSQSRAE